MHPGSSLPPPSKRVMAPKPPRKLVKAKRRLPPRPAAEEKMQVDEKAVAEEEETKESAAKRLRQGTLALTQRLPQLEPGYDTVFAYWEFKSSTCPGRLAGQKGRSALLFPDLIKPFLQVQDMAQMVRVNKRWKAICDVEIPVGFPFCSWPCHNFVPIESLLRLLAAERVS